jgi:acetoacetyl-CoA synthetase
MDIPEISAPTTEDTVFRIWRRVLDIPAQRNDRLLDVLPLVDGAGRAEHVGALLADIGASTGVHLPLTVAYASPTAAGLAAMVRTKRWPQYDRPILMRAGVGDPLFVFPGIGGMGLDMIEFACHLSYPGPVYLNPPQGIDGLEPHSTFEEIVADHIAIIRTVQANGPYRLVGYSMGGLVALEIARCLRAAGATVAFVGMLEPELREQEWTYNAWFGYMRKRIQHHLAEVWRMRSPRSALAYASGRIEPLIGRVRRLFGDNSWRPILQLTRNLAPELRKIWEAETAALDAYHVRPYDGAVMLFATRSGHAALCDPMKIWPAKVRDFDLRWIPGDHMTVLTEPKVKDTADFISNVISETTRQM